MKRLLFMLMTLISLTALAQNAEKLYTDGKQLYDEEKYTAAFPKLKAAAEKGHKKAQYRLGRCYEKGRGTTENKQLAFQWYEKSAKQDFAKAQFQLGQCYKEGEGVAKDKKKAFEFFMLAAKQENADGEYAVGKAYFKGKGVEVDKAKAKRWLTRAITNKKGGDEVLADLRKDAAAGDEDAIAMLKLTGNAK